MTLSPGDSGPVGVVQAEPGSAADDRVKATLARSQAPYDGPTEAQVSGVPGVASETPTTANAIAAAAKTAGLAAPVADSAIASQGRVHITRGACRGSEA